MRVLIITGGTSSERKISLISAKNVKKGLEEAGYKVRFFDLKRGYKQLRIITGNFDVIFPVIHGREGEDGTLYKFLINLGKPYVGCKPESTRKALDKILFNRFCDKNKIPKPAWKTVKNVSEIKRFGFPCVLKAAHGGSSKEVVILNSDKDLKKNLVKRIFSLNDSFLVERFINGIEVTVGVLFNKPLPIIEIVPPETGWFDYKNKYNGASQEIANAPSLDEKTKKLAQNIALSINKKLNLFPYSRTDFIVGREYDSKGRNIVSENIPYVLEVNPPNGVGLTSGSLFPKAAAAANIPFAKLIDKLVRLTLKNY